MIKKVVLPTKMDITREIKSYDISDYISLPSLHSKRSFQKYGYSEQKLFVNPYGVDFRMFRRINIRPRYDVIMSGIWSFQKGCDLLSKALEGTGISLLHVGSIGDCPFPDTDNFFHIGKVEQSDLYNYYNNARIMVLPSRQDGFGMVLCQGLACGLPIVCTKDTGGDDIIRMMGSKDFITVVSVTDVENIREAIIDALKKAKSSRISDEYIKKEKKELSWEAYGKRYASFLDSVI